MPIRQAGSLAAGILAGITLVFAAGQWIGHEPGSDDETRSVPEPDVALREELERAGAEIERLRAQLVEARARAQPEITPSVADAHVATLDEPDEDIEEAATSIDRLAAAVREALAAFESDPESRDLYERHSKDEASLPGWDPDRFLEDRRINPHAVTLSAEERREFELMYALACRRVEAIDLRKRLIVAEFVAGEIEERLDGADGEMSEVSGESRVVYLPGSFSFVLTADAYSEIGLLEDEKKVTVFEWLTEAKDFFASIE